jgi:hypothetical protein
MKPGDKVTVEINGKLFTDVITSVSYHSPAPQPLPPRPWWWRLARRLRLVKPAPLPPPVPSEVVLTLGGDETADPPLGWTLADVEKLREGLWWS